MSFLHTFDMHVDLHGFIKRPWDLTLLILSDLIEFMIVILLCRCHVASPVFRPWTLHFILLIIPVTYTSSIVISAKAYSSNARQSKLIEINCNITECYEL